jgi:hypothetical protein
MPPWGSVNLSVDTKDDNDNGESEINPLLMVVDGTGHRLGIFSGGGEGAPCSFPPVCGAFCPVVTALPCGRGGKHSIIVRDTDAEAFGFGDSCQEGGGYTLVVEVFGADGRSLSEREVELGGGPRREVPSFLRGLGLGPTGPALDDEGVPHQVQLD